MLERCRYGPRSRRIAPDRLDRPHSIPAALSRPREIKRIMKARFAFVLLAATFIMLGKALAAEGDRVDARFEI